MNNNYQPEHPKKSFFYSFLNKDLLEVLSFLNKDLMEVHKEGEVAEKQYLEQT